MPVPWTVFYGEVHSVRTLGRISGLQESFPNDRYPGLTEQQDVAIGVIHQALDAGISLLDTAVIKHPVGILWGTMKLSLERLLPVGKQVLNRKQKLSDKARTCLC